MINVVKKKSKTFSVKSKTFSILIISKKKMNKNTFIKIKQLKLTNSQ